MILLASQQPEIAEIRETAAATDPVISDHEAGRLATYYDHKEPEDVIEWALDRFGVDNVSFACSFSGPEGLVILDMAWNIDPDINVFCSDTGRLPQATYDLIDEVRDQYAIDIDILYPPAAALESYVKRHGLNGFKESVKNRLLCCEIRKVIPTQEHLKTVSAWSTGLRRGQWATRTNIRKIELDHDHGGIVKLNPLADWAEDEVWDYIHEFDVPYNRLHDQGYSSIGCEPCTRPTKEGEDKRAGRWWWEEDAPKECGMHCSIFTGGFEHELEEILKETGHAGDD